MWEENVDSFPPMYAPMEEQTCNLVMRTKPQPFGVWKDAPTNSYGGQGKLASS